MASTESTEERLKAALADRYRIEREIGSGGMATVYLAEDLKHKRQVAIKVLDPDLAQTLGAERFLREIETAANLTHPHILPVHDSGEADGFLFYVMPYVEGDSLRSRLTKEKQLPVEDAIQITREIADALAYAHREGVIHRDVKPANIMLAEGHAVLADFGVAHAVAEARDDRITRTGTSLGTPAYMSPEQASGEEDLDGRSDQYALGCVLYEMLAGHPPFTGAQVEAVLRQHLTEVPPSVTRVRASVPEEVAKVIHRTLAKNPADRFRTAGDMATALAVTTPRTTERGKRTPTPLGTTLGLLALAVIAVGVVWMVWGPAVEEPLGGRPRVAVLPLANLSGLEEDLYFTEGIHGQILTQLSKIGALDVISSTSAREYRDSPENLRTIGVELGARYIAEGDVLRAGDMVRVNVQLIDAQTDTHLWAESYDRPLSVENLLSIQTEVARAIADKLHAVLDPEEQEELERRPTDNLEAYDFYLRGLAYSGSVGSAGYTEESYEYALEMFEQAIGLDPSFALAHAWVAVVHLGMVYMSYGSREEHLGLARTSVDLALELAPGLPEAHLALSYYYQRLPDLDRALREIAIAEEGLPGDATVLSRKAAVLWRMGRWEEAVGLKYREVALDPRDPGGLRALGRWLKALRRYDQAEQYLGQSLRLRPDNVAARNDLASIPWEREGNPEPLRRWSMRQDLPYVPWVGTLRWSHLLAARDFEAALDVLRTMDVEFESWAPYFPRPLLEALTHHLMGNSDLAAAAFETARLVLEEDIQDQRSDPRIHRALALAYAGLGMREEAIQEASVVVDLLPDFQVPSGYIGFEDWGFVWVYSLLGDHDRTLEHLDPLMASPVGPSVNRVRADPLFDDLRDHPRFQALLDKYADDVER